MDQVMDKSDGFKVLQIEREQKHVKTSMFTDLPQEVATMKTGLEPTPG